MVRDKVTFRGGPLDGAVMPGEVVPWVAFVPRSVSGRTGPEERMSWDWVSSRPHYKLVGGGRGMRLFAWCKPRRR